MPTSLLPYRLSICGIDELPGFAEHGITHVVSILDPSHPGLECFTAYRPHARVTWRYDDVVVLTPGHTAPQERDVQAILDLGEKLRGEPVEHLLVHCHAGVSRSTATAVILMTQHNPGREADAFAALSRVRPRNWPNSRMLRMADELLGRNGALVAAMREHHAQVARAFPDFADMIRRHRADEMPDLV